MKTFQPGRLRADYLNSVVGRLESNGATLAGNGMASDKGIDGTRVSIAQSYPNGYRGTVVQAVNETGAAIERGSCVILTGLRTGGEAQYRGAIVYKAEKPTDESADKIAIALAKISDKCSGSFLSIGHAMALVTGSGDYATPQSNEVTLLLGESGPIPVIWKDEGAGWAEVKLGGGGAGGVIYNLVANDGD